MFSKSHIKNPYPSDKVKDSSAYQHLKDYEQIKSNSIDLGETTRYGDKGNGLFQADIAKFITSKCLYNDLVSAKTKQQAGYYLQAAAKANEKAESGEANNQLGTYCVTLQDILHSQQYWLHIYEDCLKLAKTTRLPRPEIITRSAVFGEAISKFSEHIVGLYNTLEGVTIDSGDVELGNYDNTLPVLKLDLLLSYCHHKSNSIDIGNGDGLSELDAGKYFLARWLRIKIAKESWDSDNLKFILIAASNINEQLESKKILINMNTTLHSIFEMQQHIDNCCKKEYAAVIAVLENESSTIKEIKDDDELNDFEWISSHPEPAVIISSTFLGFNFNSILSKRITELYNGIHEFNEAKKIKSMDYSSSGCSL